MSYVPDSPLALLVRRARFVAPVNDADAATACCTLTLGLSVIGKLMSYSGDVGELSTSDLATLGALLTELSATAHELAEMERESAAGGQAHV